jgi:A/G-specific adenine glycosylase
MAQQTQVGRVAVFYRQWLKQFPSFTALATAPAADVLRAWSGLGYNSRALRFHRLAKDVVSQYHSRLPRVTEQLLRLPGIGRYTAHAVCCFAFGLRVPVVDVNIRRIVTRWTRSVSSAAEQLPENDAWNAAELLLPKKNFVDWNQALMDFGAMMCTARNPHCSECPVSRLCASAFSPVFLQPAKNTKKTEPTWKGIPRRLYRGKILKMLHHHALSPAEAAAALWEHPAQWDVEWITALMHSMQRDGLLTAHGKTFRIVST